MESIGEKLRMAREEKSLSVDQVARDTNIAKRYIVALEDEAFAEFPGEPYLIGFLRNYADYLGLDSEEIVGLYKNFKIQEQPVPMEELLEPKRSGSRPAIIVIGILIVVLIVAGVFLYPTVTGQKSAKAASSSKTVAAGTGTEIKLTDEFIERRFVSGDSVLVPVGDKIYKVIMTEQGGSLILTYPGGRTSLQVGEEKYINLSGSSVPDLKVTLQQIDPADPAQGFVARFDRFTQSPAGAPPPHTAAPPSPQTAGAGKPPVQTAATPPAAPAPVVTGTGPEHAPYTGTQSPAPEAAPPASAATVAPHVATLSTTAPSATASPTVPTISPQSSGGSSSGPTVILQAASATPFTMNVSFDAYCVFRSAIDGQASQQRYFQSGETTRLSASESVEIWASNGGALQATISGRNVDLGNAGQVIARRIAWVKNSTSGMYDLEMTRMP